MFDLQVQVNNDSRDDYYTPKRLFDALGLQFDVDVCAPRGGVPWLPASKHYSIIDDGLQQEWLGRVWCNPPYSKPGPWIERMIIHNNGVALVCTSKAAWFQNAWNNAGGVLLLPNDLKFTRPDGAVKGIFMQTVLFGFGAENVEAMRQSNLGFVR